MHCDRHRLWQVVPRCGCGIEQAGGQPCQSTHCRAGLADDLPDDARKLYFAAIAKVGDKPKGLFITLFVNWVVKPFSMAFLGWLFFKQVFIGLIGPEMANQYMAGVIILAAAPCTAMVFVWSYLTDGDPAYTLVQVAINDL